ncbi:MAG: YfcC family protein [Bacteroidales bacterium]|nr:YfcC family protein [Bacteroidales bacterium]
MFKKFPHTYVIIFCLIIFAAMLTWIIPGGKYTEEIITENGIQRKVMQFHYTENVKQSWQVFSAIFKGFQRQSGIIAFILLIGGAFWIMNNSKAIDAGIYAFLRFTKRLEHNRILKNVGVNNIMLVLIMLMFSVFGAVFGMSEETIAFVIILVPLAITMGYDSITGVAVVFVAAGLGFAGAILNPFTIGIAQSIAEIPMFSGIGYRMFCWLIINAAGISYIIWYAHAVALKPEKSPVYNEDEYWRKRAAENSPDIAYNTPAAAWTTYILLSLALILASVIHSVTQVKIGNMTSVIPLIPVASMVFIISGIFTLKKSVHFFILNLLLFTIIFLIIGVMAYRWYIMEIATLFFAMGILAGIATGKSPNGIVQLFLEGVKDILPAAMVVGLAGGIIVILEEGQIIDTILFKLSNSMNSLGKISTVGMMYIIQTIINVVIPSGSAKAALTMPIMAPFSDLVGLSRQVTVMAFQFGDGFTNMITPTSGVLIGVIGVARIPYQKWVKWVTPLMIILILLGFLLLIPTVTMPLEGF